MGVSTHDPPVSLVFLDLLEGDILDIPTRGIDIFVGRNSDAVPGEVRHEVGRLGERLCVAAE